MSNKQIRDLLAKLKKEMQRTELDEDTRAMVQDLDSEIHELLEAGDDEPVTDAVVEKARQLETSFAAEHPGIERFMREVIDALVRMGI